MAKFRPVGRKGKQAAKPVGAVPCVILLIAALALVMLFLYFVMKYSAQ